MTFITKNRTNLMIAAAIGALAIWTILQATAQPESRRVVGVVEIGEIQ